MRRVSPVLVLLSASVAAAAPPDAGEAQDTYVQGVAALTAGRAALDAGLSETAAARFEEACQAGLGAGCAALGQLLVEAARDAEAVPFLERGCELNEGAACLELGYMLEAGRGLDLDVKRALQVHERGCAAGEARACGAQGRLLMQRQPPAAREAAVAFRKACEAKDAWGCALLGQLFLDGAGVKRDPARAQKYFDRGCEGGAGQGCMRVGELLAAAAEPASTDGHKTLVRAARYFERACHMSYARGCTQAGRFHQLGRGVEQSLPRAVAFFRTGCAAGHKLACDHLKGLGLLRGPVKAPRARP